MTRAKSHPCGVYSFTCNSSCNPHNCNETGLVSPSLERTATEAQRGGATLLRVTQLVGNGAAIPNPQLPGTAGHSLRDQLASLQILPFHLPAA